MRVFPLPGSNGPLDDNHNRTLALAKEIGYPVIIKAAAGGGGRGMRVVHNEAALLKAIHVTQTEAKSFGDGTVYLEKFLENPRHVEIQGHWRRWGEAICLGTETAHCSAGIKKSSRKRLLRGFPMKCARQLPKPAYRPPRICATERAGTLEFLYEDERFYFIEMNTRVQVEHPVTEMVTGIDIVKEQLRVASGLPLSVKQEDITIKGHSFECRINAEDPTSFLPNPGKVKLFHAPGGPGVRVDSHLYSGYSVPPFYDSLVAKLISYADSREQAWSACKSRSMSCSLMVFAAIRLCTVIWSETANFNKAG